MEEAIAAVSAVGFPIVVTFYLLFRLQKTLDAFTQELHRLVTIIEHIEQERNNNYNR